MAGQDHNAFRQVFNCNSANTGRTHGAGAHFSVRLSSVVSVGFLNPEKRSSTERAGPSLLLNRMQAQQG